MQFNFDNILAALLALTVAAIALIVAWSIT